MYLTANHLRRTIFPLARCAVPSRAQTQSCLRRVRRSKPIGLKHTERELKRGTPVTNTERMLGATGRTGQTSVDTFHKYLRTVSVADHFIIYNNMHDTYKTRRGSRIQKGGGSYIQKGGFRTGISGADPNCGQINKQNKNCRQP